MAAPLLHNMESGRCGRLDADDADGRCRYQLRRCGRPATYPGVVDVFKITKRVTLIGRNKNAVDFFITSRKFMDFISRIHAEIRRCTDPDRGDLDLYSLVDHNSVNGTFVNNRKIGDMPMALDNGDIITLGHFRGHLLAEGDVAKQPESEFRFIFEKIQSDASGNQSRNFTTSKFCQNPWQPLSVVNRFFQADTVLPFQVNAGDKKLLENTTIPGSNYGNINTHDNSGIEAACTNDEEEESKSDIDIFGDNEPPEINESRRSSSVILLDSDDQLEPEEEEPHLPLPGRSGPLPPAAANQSTSHMTTSHMTVRGGGGVDSIGFGRTSSPLPEVSLAVPVDEAPSPTTSSPGFTGIAVASSSSPGFTGIAVASSSGSPPGVAGVTVAGASSGRIATTTVTLADRDQHFKSSRTSSTTLLSVRERLPLSAPEMAETGNGQPGSLTNNKSLPTLKIKRRSTRKKKNAKWSVSRSKTASNQEINQSDDEREYCDLSGCIRPDGWNVTWVQCDDCHGWYHTYCVGCSYDLVKDENTFFHCGCQGKPRSAQV